jgi:uncharacterized cupin superfamily protein
VGIAHLDEIPKRRNVRGQMAGTWSNLGAAAGTSRAGASRLELAPGEQPTPPHVHGEAEEIFFVLSGSGLTLLDDDAYEIRAGDCIVYRNLHEEHTIRAGDEGLDVIAFGAREDLPAGELPRGRSMWSSTGYIEVQEGHPWDREPELVWPEPKQERPPVIVATSDLEPDVRDGRRRRDLGRAGGSRWTGLKHLELDPGTSQARGTVIPPRKRSLSCSPAKGPSSSPGRARPRLTLSARGPWSRVRRARGSHTRSGRVSRA